MLKNPANIKKKAAHYYLKQIGEEKYELNQEKIEQSAKYDGYFCIATNIKNPVISDLLDNYKHLFQIEHSFRTMKSHLETRPMFHWTDKRIQGHICLCYMAYTLLTNLQIRIKKADLKMSEEEIRKTIIKMQLSLIEQGNERYYLRSALTNEMEELMKVLKIKKMPDMVPISHIDKYL
jgi:transposase